MPSSWPCKFYNSESGCKNQADMCSHRHVDFCTNKLCTESNKHHTHTLLSCGRKGGGSHANYIAKKKEQAILEKKPEVEEPPREDFDSVRKRLILEVDTVAACELLYVKVKEILDTSDGVAEKEFGVNPTPGKIVGMFKSGLSLKDLHEMLEDPKILTDRMVEAYEVIAKHAEKTE